MTITQIHAIDNRYALAPGEGADAVHTNPVYALATALLHTDAGEIGTGFVLTLGAGNDLVCRAIEALGAELVGQDIEDVMAQFGALTRRLADHPQWRWLGPHKGIVHLALASVVNACFDLWARARGVPLWSLLLDLSPEALVALLDLSYLEDVLTEADALALLRAEMPGRDARAGIIDDGYPGYDTSVGWFGYDDDTIRRNAVEAVAQGFTAIKLKVGSRDPERDIRRAHLVRDAVGPDVRVMLDCNQQWTLPDAIRRCQALASMDPFWIEEPTHPDDVLAHAALAREIAPVKVALGEHVPNRVLFKNFLQAGAMHFVQPDMTRLAGVSEFLTVSLLARTFGLPVVPHVGDMGQVHQHLVLFNRVALGHEVVFLEHIPHLRRHFAEPAAVESGVYRTPQRPGASAALVD